MVARPRTLSRTQRSSGEPSGYTLANIFEADAENPNFVGQWNGNENEFEEPTAQASLQVRFGELQSTNHGNTDDLVMLVVLNTLEFHMHVQRYI